MLSFFQKKEQPSIFKDVESIKVEFNIPQQYISQISMMALNEKDIQILHCLQPIISKHTKELVEKFYEAIMKEPTLTEIIHRNSTVEKLGQTLYRHIIGIFSGKVNQEYVNQRKRVAHAHVRIGLSTKWYLNAFQHLMNLITEKLNQEIPNRHELYQAIHALQKIFSLEQQLVLEAYEKKESEIRKAIDDEKDKIRLRMQMTAKELSEIAEETGASLEDLITQFIHIQSLTEDSQQAIQKVFSLSEDGKNKMNEEKNSSNLIQEQVNIIYKNIELLLELSKKIESVVDVVTSIANQINLLSLNASIESAHAGEHGKGFAVVANEIRNLSNRTKESTVNIASLVKEISNQVQHVSSTVEDFHQHIQQNKEITDKMLQSFHEIVEAVQQSKEKTDIVFEEIKNSEEVIQQIREATLNLTETADELK